MNQTSENIVSVPSYNKQLTCQQFSKIIHNKLIEQNDNIAFIDFLSKKQYSYNEILENGIKLAVSLKKMGLKKDDTIIILLENNIFYWIITIACLFSGITMHLLNVEYTNYELQYFLNMTKSNTLFCSNKSLNMAIWARKEFKDIQNLICVDVCTDKDVIMIKNMLDINYHINDYVLEIIDDKKQVAFILNSSGTTGVSKGVMITHNNLKSMLEYHSHPDYFGFSAIDTTILFLPYFHIFGILIAINTMVFGMKSIIMTKFQPEHFLKAIEEYKVTHLFLVPPVALFLTKSEMIYQYNLTSINSVMCGAAPLGSAIEEQFIERFNVPIRQVYGMTELTGLINIVPKSLKSKKAGTVGKLIPDSFAKIRDVITSELLGPYKRGELCVKSDIIMNGYLNNPEESANIIDADGYLHTGDIGYYDNDQYFYVVDRLKELIKYKAFQVAPAELENIINSHDGVVDSAVIGVPDERAGESARAYVVKKPNYKLDENDIVKYVAERVITQKQLHGGVIFVSEIPKSPTGKILRRKLK